MKLVQSIEENTKHYVEILSRAVDETMPEPSADPTYVAIHPRCRYERNLTDAKIDSRTTCWTS